MSAAAARESTITPDSRVYYAALGRRIEQLRRSRGYTQAELGRALGVSQQAIFAYQLGDRRVSVMILDRIATLYGISVDQVIGRAPERKPPPNRRLSPRAMRHAERIQGLSKTSQRFIVRLIDYLETIQRARS
ncbi:MAG: helix-turn-helix transcriptional regulator [Pseudomonadota bacterium]|nr:helix-turn-helix transcriptional regulator [Pseudomonadota bacterium]